MAMEARNVIDTKGFCFNCFVKAQEQENGQCVHSQSIKHILERVPGLGIGEVLKQELETMTKEEVSVLLCRGCALPNAELIPLFKKMDKKCHEGYRLNDQLNLTKKQMGGIRGDEAFRLLDQLDLVKKQIDEIGGQIDMKFEMLSSRASLETLENGKTRRELIEEYKKKMIQETRNEELMKDIDVFRSKFHHKIATTKLGETAQSAGEEQQESVPEPVAGFSSPDETSNSDLISFCTTTGIPSAMLTPTESVMDASFDSPRDKMEPEDQQTPKVLSESSPQHPFQCAQSSSASGKDSTQLNQQSPRNSKKKALQNLKGWSQDIHKATRQGYRYNRNARIAQSQANSENKRRSVRGLEQDQPQRRLRKVSNNSRTSYYCLCRRRFKHRYLLTRHYRTCRKDNRVESTKYIFNKETGKFKCRKCENVYSHRPSCYLHYKLKHLNEQVNKPTTVKCPLCKMEEVRDPVSLKTHLECEKCFKQCQNELIFVRNVATSTTQVQHESSGSEDDMDYEQKVYQYYNNH